MADAKGGLIRRNRPGMKAEVTHLVHKIFT